MSELARRPETGLDFHVHKQTIDAAEREATTQIYQETNRAYQQAVTQQVEELEQIRDEKLLRYVIPFFEDSTRQMARDLLEEQAAATRHIRAVATEWRSRIHY
jgi:hypothetical protein